MTQPQLSLFLSPDGTLRAESPSFSSSRNKIDLATYSISDLPFPLQAELLSQRQRILEEEARAKQRLEVSRLETRRRVFTQLLHDHPATALRVMPYMANDPTVKRGLKKTPPRPIDPATLGL